jgi:glycosyltransferase involved in cell wall biosynthesis
MIVKNEAHVIEETLRNLVGKLPISCFAISDTGSTDETREIIRRTMSELNIAGRIEDHPWKDFSHNRNLSLKLAGDVTRDLGNKVKYALVFDADDVIIGDPVLPSMLTAPSYRMKIGEGFTYLREQIVRLDAGWSYRGVVHEVIGRANQEPGEVIGGDYHIDSRRTGARNKDDNKYHRDAALIEEALKTEKDPGLVRRYNFYLAQSYKDAGMRDKSISAYQTVASDSNTWAQERFYSCYMLGFLHQYEGDADKSIKNWLQTVEYDNTRIDGVVNAMTTLRGAGQHQQVMMLYRAWKHITSPPKDALFLSSADYDYRMQYEASISGFYANEHKDGSEACAQCIVCRTANDNSLDNWQFYCPRVDRLISPISETDASPRYQTLLDTSPVGKGGMTSIVRVPTTSSLVYHVAKVGNAKATLPFVFQSPTANEKVTEVQEHTDHIVVRYTSGEQSYSVLMRDIDIHNAAVVSLL